MAKNLNLNIQRFGEGSFDPTAFNQLVSDYEANLPGVNNTISQNQEVIRVFNNLAGSPALTEHTTPIIDKLNSCIESAANYFDNVKAWVNWISDYVAENNGAFGVSLPFISASVNREHLDYAKERYDGNFVGIQNISDASTFVSGMQDVITTLKNALEQITSDVASAKNSLPDEVIASASAKVSVENEGLLSLYGGISTELTDYVDEWASVIANFVEQTVSATERI